MYVQVVGYFISNVIIVIRTQFIRQGIDELGEVFNYVKYGVDVYGGD